MDPQKRRISLGLKQCLGNPWDTFAAEHPAGTIVEGEIKNITEFGLFIGLSGEIDGMVHLSDLDWNRSGEEAIAQYKKGDVVKAKVLDVDIEKERISLGIKQLEADPFASGIGDIKKGDTVTCTVSAVLDNGIEVKVNDAIHGFIRKSDLSSDRSGPLRAGREGRRQGDGGRQVEPQAEPLDQGARGAGGEGSDGRIRQLRLRRFARRYSRRRAALEAGRGTAEGRRRR